ncbi:MAG: glycogen debranching protein GlgX [Burkholderiaceae bacterium]
MEALKRRGAARTRSAQRDLLPGHPWPMGSSYDGRGVNFAVFSSAAQGIELCLYDSRGLHETRRITMPARTGDIWHGYLPGAEPGLVYGLRAQGPWRPDHGEWFNPAKLLLDPYARDVVGQFVWRDEQFAHDRSLPLHRDDRDNSEFALKARVVLDAYDWGDDRRPERAPEHTLLYELHVKGFSKLHPGVPEALRGTFAGLAHPACIAHLQRLGVTAVSLMPVHYALDEERLVQRGLHNYWGYNSIAFFSLDPALGSQPEGQPLRNEFRDMVRALHAAGIEVLLDVVFNHTAEGDGSGPAISMRGLDNAAYYRMASGTQGQYENQSGCGNTMDIRNPCVLRLVLDSLRYWVGEMHVDGFRFDLATVLGRGDKGFERDGPFFTALAQDPLLSSVKLIAEPWDLGSGGYQLGGFPRGWLEWNDQFRDTMRSFWFELGATRGDFAMRLCASSDLYQGRNRSPIESVNYLSSHDGFTLRDLVSYNERHNLANGEDNRDGQEHNLSFNCGVEGPSADPAVVALRARMQRALLACMLLSQGTPMLCAGCELGHSQGGNNNPYNQDNATTWIDWASADEDLIAFVERLVALRRNALPFAAHWYSGQPDALGLRDLAWLQPDGDLVPGENWHDPGRRALACLIGSPGQAQAPLLLLVNAAVQEQAFTLPAGVWQALFDSADARGRAHWHGQGEVAIKVQPRSVQLLAAAGAGVK